MKEPRAFSIILPTLNEEKAIGAVIDEIHEQSIGNDAEIIVVDSSTDNTPVIAHHMGIIVVTMPPLGYGAAIRAGLAHATRDIIITADCDYTYPMKVIPIMIELVTSKAADLVSGNRLNANLRKNMPILNKYANRVFAFLVRVLYGFTVRDVTTGMLCFSRDLIERVRPENALTFPVETIIKVHKAGYVHRELDIPYRKRIGRSTLQKWRSGKAILLCILNYRFRLNIDPARM